MWIPDPRFEMPGLFEPNFKPTAPVVIDRDHQLAPDELCFISQKELVKGNSKHNSLITNAVADGKMMLNTAPDDLNKVIDFNNTVTWSDYQPFTLVWRLKQDASGHGMVGGVRSTATNYIWLQSSTTLVMNCNGSARNFGSILSSATKFETVVFTTDGGGTSASTGRVYIDGVKVYEASSLHFGIRLDCLFQGFNNSDTYNFVGKFEFFYAYNRRLLDAQIKDLTNRPYQFLIPE